MMPVLLRRSLKATLSPPAGPDGDAVLRVDQAASPPLAELDPQHAAVLSEIVDPPGEAVSIDRLNGHRLPAAQVLPVHPGIR